MNDNIYIWDLETAKREHQFSEILASEISRMLLRANNIRTVFDFGCGIGAYCKFLSECGFECYGYEGTKGIAEIAVFDNIIEQDLTCAFDLGIRGNVICLEVAEHILPRDETPFLINVTKHVATDALLVLSWAIEGQGGCGHHNEKNANYVIRTIEVLGFRHLPKQSQELRNAGGKELWWFQNSIYVFKRTK